MRQQNFSTPEAGRAFDHSEEVVRCAASDVGFSTTRRRVEHQEIVIHLLVDFHYASLVAAPVAVVWRGENRHHLLLMGPVVALAGAVETSVRLVVQEALVYRDLPS